MSTIYDIFFIINLVILIGIISYRCLKKQTKAIIFDIVALSLFVLVKAVQINYATIRDGLYDLLGKERFADLREILRVLLFFGSSITVSIQIFSEFVSLIVLVFLATKAVVVIFVKKCSKKIFSSSVSPKNDKVADKCNSLSGGSLYLILGRLIN